MLSDDQLMRYSRQILLPQFDVAGQEALLRARVLIVGAGGLGCPAAMDLAGAGVGEIHIVDADEVETSNLHRQLAYSEADVGRSKAEVLTERLQAINSEITVRTHIRRADQAWLAAWLRADARVAAPVLVLDCSDNFATRGDINRACVAAHVPLISGAAIRFEGQLAVFDFREENRPCYACLYGEGETPDTLCSESGVLGPVVGAVGTMQALLAMRLLMGERLPARLYLFDGAGMTWRDVGFARDTSCPVCKFFVAQKT